MTTTHDITETDIGVRARATSRHQDTDTTITYEGTVTAVWQHHAFSLGGTYVIGSSLGDRPGWTVEVERLRPAVPTLPGAVVRLDGPDGTIAALLPDDSQDTTPWCPTGVSFWLGDCDIAARIHAVIFPGVEK